MGQRVFKVGDKVKYIDSDGIYINYKNNIGVIKVVDDSTVPYKVEFGDIGVLWCYADDLQLAKNEIVKQLINDL